MRPHRKWCSALLTTTLACAITPAQLRARTVVVSQDGSGDATTLSAGVAAFRAGQTLAVDTLLVRPGSYDELVDLPIPSGDTLCNNTYNHQGAVLLCPSGADSTIVRGLTFNTLPSLDCGTRWYWDVRGVTLRQHEDCGRNIGFMVWHNDVFDSTYTATSPSCTIPNTFGCRFHDRVILVGFDSGYATFDSCTYDQAPVYAESDACGQLRFTNCTFSGPVDTAVVAYSIGDAYVSFENCAFTGSQYGIAVRPAPSCDEELRVLRSTFLNIARTAVVFSYDPGADDASCVPLSLRIHDTKIANCGMGVSWHTRFPGSVRMSRDTVAACSDSAVAADVRSADFDSLVIQDVAGPALTLDVHDEPYFLRIHPRLLHIHNCSIGRVGGGISIAYDGNATGEPSLDAQNNTVVGAGGDGLSASVPATTSFFHAWRVSSNVVGRATGGGITLSAPSVAVMLESNTAYDNHGDGLGLAAAASDSVDHNIAYRNGGAGLHLTNGIQVTQGCNDWFGNRGISGWGADAVPAPTDVAVDPQFCDVTHDDVALVSGSPLLVAAGCGLIGALGLGCQARSPDAEVSKDLQLRTRPQPAAGSTTFSWDPAASASELLIFDATGALRWRAAVSAGAATLNWNAADSRGRRLAPGVYFARLRTRGGEGMARVIVVR